MEKVVTCPTHNDRDVAFAYLGKECKYKSRFACNQCIEDYETVENFKDFRNVQDYWIQLLQSVNPLFKVKREQGPYDELVQYFDLLTVDFDKLFEGYVKKVNEQIDELKTMLKAAIGEFNKMKEAIKVASLKLKDILGHTAFKQSHDKIILVKNYHASAEWKSLEENLNKLVESVYTQDNQEVKDQIMQIQQIALNFQKLNDYKKINQVQTTLQNELDNLFQKLAINLNVGIFDFTKICQSEFLGRLIMRIRGTKEITQKPTLIFKLALHGIANFWKQLTASPVVIFFKAKNQIFGVYTPVQIESSSTWIADPSLSSFIFSANKNQFYPLKQAAFAVYGYEKNSNHLIGFGNQHDLAIDSNLKCTSNLNGSYAAEKIQDTKSHLFGEKSITIEDIEIYQIQ